MKTSAQIEYRIKTEGLEAEYDSRLLGTEWFIAPGLERSSLEMADWGKDATSSPAMDGD